MAKLSCHGTIVGTVYFTTKAKRYMSDGVVLQNIGFGWKLLGKVKDGATPEQAFKVQMDKQAAFFSKFPGIAAYRKELHSLAGMSTRWKLHAAVELMPDDPDGVWSEACDGYGDNAHADVQEICKLCALYKLAIAQAAEAACGKLPLTQATEGANADV